MIGDYPTPVCTLHGYLEELDNPYHNIGEKCPDYMYPISNLVGSRAKLMLLEDLGTPEKELKSMIEEILLLENILGENNDRSYT